MHDSRHERLTDIAAVFETVILQARSATSRAQVALADGADTEAHGAARVAINLWRDVGAPYETAQAQCLVAEAALRIDDRAVAIVEIDAAIAAFENLGAARDLEAAQRLRHRLGATTVGRPVQRTFMFTDIVDSTRLVAECGNEAGRTRPRADHRRNENPSRVHRARADVRGRSPTSDGRPNLALTCRDGSLPSANVRREDVRNVEVVGSSPITSTREAAGHGPSESSGPEPAPCSSPRESSRSLAQGRSLRPRRPLAAVSRRHRWSLGSTSGRAAA